MEQALFDDLVQSLKEAKAIARGEAPASRRIKVTMPDAKAVREQIGLSQSEFAQLMQVSIKTLQNWEQHRRNPTGPEHGNPHIDSVKQSHGEGIAHSFSDRPSA